MMMTNHEEEIFYSDDELSDNDLYQQVKYTYIHPWNSEISFFLMFSKIFSLYTVC